MSTASTGDGGHVGRDGRPPEDETARAPADSRRAVPLLSRPG